jgi:hypothetical protein
MRGTFISTSHLFIVPMVLSTVVQYLAMHEFFSYSPHQKPALFTLATLSSLSSLVVPSKPLPHNTPTSNTHSQVVWRQGESDTTEFEEEEVGERIESTIGEGEITIGESDVL